MLCHCHIIVSMVHEPSQFSQVERITVFWPVLAGPGRAVRCDTVMQEQDLRTVEIF